MTHEMDSNPLQRSGRTMAGPTRREFLAAALGTAAAAAVPRSALGQTDAAAPAPAGARAFRFVHLTDIHVQPERRAAEGLARALAAVEALKPRPEFILTGGDQVFDVMKTGPQRAGQLFALYKKVLADHTALPVRETIGNHDVFGWLPAAGVSPQTPGYGKELFKEQLGLRSTYYRFDHKGWRIFVLDNIQPGGSRGYQGFLDEPQLAWFQRELEATPPTTPIIICEHIPMLTVTPFAFESTQQDRVWRIENSLVCGDTVQRLALIRRRNVRLCLSGHTHQRDHVQFAGTTFINDGAVSGNWWKGDFRGVEEGFGVIDLNADGSLAYQYFDYGWNVPG